MNSFSIKRTNYIFFNSENNAKLFDLIFLYIFLIGLYTGIFYYFKEEGKFIPFVICGFCAPVFFLRNIRKINIHEMVPLWLIYVITFIGMLFSPDSSIYFTERTKGLIQLIYASLSGFFFYIHLLRFSKQQLEKIFLYCLLLILSGAFLERHVLPFKNMSDEFRIFFFRVGFYDNNLRDLFLYGGERVKLFTSEPSHVAKFFILSLFTWFTLTYNKNKFFLLFLFTTIGIFLIRSPIIILICPLVLLTEIFLYKKIDINALIKQNKSLLSTSLIFFIVISGIVVVVFLLTFLAARLETISQGVDESFIIRITGAWQNAFATIREYPYFGAGISGKEAIEDIIRNTFFDMNVQNYTLYAFSTNFICEFIIYYGIVGGGLFILSFYHFLNRLKISNKIFFVLTLFIFSQTMGAMMSIRVWGYLAIILYISSLNYSSLERLKQAKR
ncbi:MAG: hypothetical protein D3918_03325 [Candidatus Electrothrix sp. AX2]|nr:hypothetical protein [Candidatus Electrothrix gigas]